MFGVIVQPHLAEFLAQVQVALFSPSEVLQTLVGIGLAVWAVMFALRCGKRGMS